MKQRIVFFLNLCNLLFLFSELDLLCQHSGAKPQGLTLGVACQQKFQICWGRNSDETEGVLKAFI